MKFTEEELRQTAIRVQNRHLAQLTPKEQCADTFSASYTQQMQGLILQVKTGHIQAASLRLGWQYYTRRGVAAVLLCFLLACIAMPEAVMAGYQTVIHAVKETFFVEYTEYQYESTAAGDTKLIPLHFGYLPEDLKKIEYEEDSIDMYCMYCNLEDDEITQNKERLRYITIHQNLLTENTSSTYIVDTENAEVKNVLIQGEKVKFILKESRIQYIWLHGAYRITGQTNLPEEEVMNILDNVTFGEK